MQNGGFATSLSDWTNPTSGAIATTWEAGQAKAVVGASGGGVALLQGGMALTGGVSYELGATMRLQTAGSSATVRVIAAGDPNGAISTEASTGSTAGASVSAVLFNTSSSAKTAEVRLMVPGQAGQVVWFDDVILRALPASAEFMASRTTIATGESVTLTWATISAPQVSIDQGIGSRSRAGSVSVSPSATTTYTLTATGPIGTVSKQVTITVVPPPTVTFTVTPDTIGAGGAATLAWTTANAASVTIDQGIGAQLLNGSRPVSPTATTTYTLTATGTGGTTTRQATLTITPPKPVISFTASRRTIAAGEETTLSWQVTNATSVSINHGIGNRALTGSVRVAPLTTTTYRLTASGPGGSASDDLTITVLAPPVIIFTATPETISRGQGTMLTWNVTDATLVVIDNGVGVQPPGGALEVRPQENTTYVLTATGPGGVSVAQATVTIKTVGRRRSVRH
ncbi:MAG: hypothetical protein M3P06_03170 [Acidobacteriota bacterium]|nr:hypothetical protein [Acidobacteriota bacterium]